MDTSYKRNGWRVTGKNDNECRTTDDKLILLEQ